MDKCPGKPTAGTARMSPAPQSSDLPSTLFSACYINPVIAICGVKFVNQLCACLAGQSSSIGNGILPELRLLQFFGKGARRDRRNPGHCSELYTNKLLRS
ncbi:putative disintegrin and metalloproteinase with thrombospondin motif [Trichinella pseudospiralis]